MHRFCNRIQSVMRYCTRQIETVQFSSRQPSQRRLQASLGTQALVHIFVFRIKRVFNCSFGSSGSYARLDVRYVANIKLVIVAFSLLLTLQVTDACCMAKMSRMFVNQHFIVITNLFRWNPLYIQHFGPTSTFSREQQQVYFVWYPHNQRRHRKNQGDANSPYLGA